MTMENRVVTLPTVKIEGETIPVVPGGYDARSQAGGLWTVDGPVVPTPGRRGGHHSLYAILWQKSLSVGTGVYVAFADKATLDKIGPGQKLTEASIPGTLRGYDLNAIVEDTAVITP